MKSIATAAFLAATTLAWATGPLVDLNGDGMGDVWQHRFGAIGIDAAIDSDGDGRSNLAEAMAGTNPFSAASVFAAAESTMIGTDLTLQCSAQPGKSYQLASNTALAGGTWIPEGSPQLATGNLVSITLTNGASGTEPKFFRFDVSDVDSDGDGVPDWDEMQLANYNPNAAQSAQSDQSDLTTLTNQLATASAFVTVSMVDPVAYEKEGLPAKFRVTRVGTSGDLTVHFTLGGNPDIQKGSASSGDYTLKDGAAQAIGTSVVIPNGASSADVLVHPLPDSLNEVPEMLALSIATDPSYLIGPSGAASVVINDAQNTQANERLFVAYLTSQSGATTSASGISTVRLRGDNTLGIVDLHFSGLTTIQTSVHIHAVNPASTTGPDVESLELGQVIDHPWQVRAAHLITDQAMLNALFSSALYVNVHSATYPTGEIRGDYKLATGSITPPTPSDPPPIAPLTGDDLTREVARFLTQATFGPTSAEISALVADIQNNHGGDRIAGFNAWIDQQFALDQTNLLDYVQAADGQEWALRGTDPFNYVSGNEPRGNNRRRGWWPLAVKAHDQLRQRVGFALSEIFVISEMATNVSNRHYGTSKYVDTLAAHADGSFRSLIEEVSKSPMMGDYLSSLKNQKAVLDPVTGAVLISPDENYAREVMQLFSIGLVQLHQDGSLKLSTSGLPIQTYTNDDITELARVFTGWSFSKRHGSKALGYLVEDNPSFNQGTGPLYFQASWLNPMKNFAAYHDTAAKAVLGTAISAGLDGEQDLDAALDVLFNHPNTGPFLSKLLIQRLVTSNPSAGYIYRVAGKFNNDGTGVRGNFKAVIKAILLDYEARSINLIENVGYGKQKEPLIRYVQLLRAFNGVSQLPLSDLSGYGYPASQLDNFPAGATRYRYGILDTNMSQTPLRSPTVFNWFLPGYNPGGAVSAAGLVAPEMLVTNETQVIQSVNYGRSITYNTGGQSTSSLFGATDTSLDDVKIDRAPYDALYAAEIGAGKTVTQAVTTVVDQIDLVLMSGRYKAKYATAAVPNPRSLLIENVALVSESVRVRSLIYLMALTPEYLHQK